MATKKQLTDKLKTVISKTKAPKVLSLMHMPDLPDVAPHWLFWFFVLSLLALGIAIAWTQIPASSPIQTYLPTI